jgi:hypothetical protein
MDGAVALAGEEAGHIVNSDGGVGGFLRLKIAHRLRQQSAAATAFPIFALIR